MAKVRALVVAAGRGTRAGLSYPKTLFPIQGKPILVRIAELLKPFDNEITVIVSPEGEKLIRQCLRIYHIDAHLVVQSEPRGMGDAVIQFAKSPASEDDEQVLLIWGDIPFIQPKTVSTLVAAHKIQANDFTFPTRFVDSAYTVVDRDETGQVKRVSEMREGGLQQFKAGERDIGLFIFRKSLVIDMLREELAGKWGRLTGEHSFLYIVGHLVERGHRVVGIPIATELDLVSLNSMSDIEAYL